MLVNKKGFIKNFLKYRVSISVLPVIIRALYLSTGFASEVCWISVCLSYFCNGPHFSTYGDSQIQLRHQNQRGKLEFFCAKQTKRESIKLDLATQEYPGSSFPYSFRAQTLEFLAPRRESNPKDSPNVIHSTSAASTEPASLRKWRFSEETCFTTLAPQMEGDSSRAFDTISEFQRSRFAWMHGGAQ